MKKKMPKINLEHLEQILSAEDFELAKGIISTRGKNKGCLRASKPKVTRFVARVEKISTKYGVYNKEIYDVDPIEGKTAFLWRHVAFSISPHSQHHCMPTMDFCDLPGTYGQEMRQLEKYLMDLADVIIKTVDVQEWHGVKRWGQALGRIGTPQVAADGAIVYR